MSHKLNTHLRTLSTFAQGKLAAKASPAHAAVRKASPKASPVKSPAKPAVAARASPAKKPAAAKPAPAPAHAHAHAEDGHEHAPADADTKKKVDECYDRLTDPKNYHGMYKERFKEKGLIEGADASVRFLSLLMLPLPLALLSASFEHIRYHICFTRSFTKLLCCRPTRMDTRQI